MTIRRPSPARSLGAATLGLALVAGLTAPASADDPTPLSGYGPTSTIDLAAPVVSPALLGATGRVSVFVQTSGASVLDVKATARSAGATQSRVAEIDAATDAVESVATEADADATVLYVSHYTVPGIALSLDADSIAAIAELDDVVKISAITRQYVDLPDGSTTPANVNSDVLINAVQAWSAAGGGFTGDGINIAVIDTGIDYTHAAFGGTGTTDSYAAALSSPVMPAGSFDPAKILGGHDFAGERYNPSPDSPAFFPEPIEDENPIDGTGGGHGTHVAATAAGYGVTSGGDVYDGGYDAIDEATYRSMIVAPGSAPESGLYALKVFGDLGGSTDLTGAALDWVGQAISEGKSINVVNLSLGSDFGAVDDPDNAKLAELMDHGVLPVVASGNAGDLVDVAGTPSNTARTLAVAASASGSSLQDAIEVLAPADVAGTYGAQFSQGFAGTFDVEQPVVALSDTSNLEGCAAFSTADAAAVAGKIVWLEWDDADIVCGSGARFTNASNAGAVGVVLSSTVNSFESGIAGNAVIPGGQLTATATATLRPALEAGTLSVQLSSNNKAVFSSTDPDAVDTMAGFSSRGEHGSYEDIVKPDVSAPGVGIVSAASGTGFDFSVKNGTSMATPLTAGVAALVFQSHTDWTPDQVKAQIINTATHDITTGGASPVPYAPARAGTGRIDALAAVTNTVTVASENSGGLVTASFGVVEVGKDGLSETRTLTATNSGPEAVTYDLTYLARTTVPGVSYTITPSTVAVPANGSASFTVTLSIPDASALRHTLDPTMDRLQAGLPRSFVSDASGVVELTPTAGSTNTLRVAVFSAPKPVSSMHATGVELSEEGTSGRLNLDGHGFSQGSDEEAFASAVVPLQLGVVDEQLDFAADSPTKTLASLDILAIGASSTAPQLADPSAGVLTFGLVMQGPWGRIMPHSIPMVSIDVDQDGEEDFFTYLAPLNDEIDVFVAITIDSATGDTVAMEPANFQLGDVDTNIFDTNVVTLPVPIGALGFSESSATTQIAYSASTISEYAPRTTDQPDNILVDSTDTAVFDVFAPAVWFGDTSEEIVAYEDVPGFLPVNLAAAPAGQAAARAAAADPQILLLHLNNAAGATSDIVPVAQEVVPPTTEPTTDPTTDPTTTPTGDPTVTPTDGTTTPAPTSTTAAPGGALPTTGASGLMMIPVIGLLLVASGATVVVIRKRPGSAAA